MRWPTGCVLRLGGCRELRTRADGRLVGVGAMLGQMHRPRKQTQLVACIGHCRICRLCPCGRGGARRLRRGACSWCGYRACSWCVPKNGAAAPSPHRGRGFCIPSGPVDELRGRQRCTRRRPCAAWHPTAGPLPDGGRAGRDRACRRRNRCRRRLPARSRVRRQLRPAAPVGTAGGL